MQDWQRERIKQIHRFEQLAAGLRRKDPKAIEWAREFLRNLIKDGSHDRLADVFEGLQLLWEGNKK